MGLKDKFKEIRNNYVIHQANNLKLPAFQSQDIHRYKIIFSGRVQKVGFRLEVCTLANRLELSGYCKNMDNGDVLAEIQGYEDRIQFLVSFMESLKRIKITDKKIEELELKEEKGFIQL